MNNPFQLIEERLSRLERLLTSIETGVSSLKAGVVKEGSSTATRKQAAKYLSVSESTIIRLEKSGALKTIEIGNSIRFDWNHLDEYKAKNTK